MTYVSVVPSRVKEARTAEARKRAARGAKWLDERSPGWHREIDLGTLSLASSCRCIIGQLRPLAGLQLDAERARQLFPDAPRGVDRNGWYEMVHTDPSVRRRLRDYLRKRGWTRKARMILTHLQATDLGFCLAIRKGVQIGYADLDAAWLEEISKRTRK